MTAGCEGSSLVYDEVIKSTRSAERVQARRKHSTLTPPVRSSQFPGPGVYVWGVITHQVPWLPLLAFCVLWPLSSAIQLLSPQLPFALIGLEGRGWRRGGQGSQLGWGGKRVWYEMEQVFSVETVEMTRFPTTTSLRPQLTLPSHQTKARTVGNQWFDNYIELLVGFHFMCYFYIMTKRNESRASEVHYAFKALFFQIWSEKNGPNYLLNLFWIVIKSFHTLDWPCLGHCGINSIKDGNISLSPPVLY